MKKSVEEGMLKNKSVEEGLLKGHVKDGLLKKFFKEKKNLF